MKSTTHLIPASRLQELEKRIAKINKKAEKLEKPPVSMIVGDRERVTVKQGGALALRMGTSYSYDAVSVTVTGETPVVNGWQFLTTVWHRPAGNEFVNLPGTSEADLSEFVFVDKNCDHCNRKRIRNATFIIRHIETGELKQVGSTCLGDFTGYHSPQAAAKACENIYKLFFDIQTWGGTVTGRTTKRFFLEEWLAFVSYSSRVHGFVSRKRATETGEEATATKAKRHILQAGNDENVPAPTDDDFTKAQELITWVREHGDKINAGDFKDNLLAAYRSDDDAAVGEGEMALTAAGFPVMWAILASEAKTAQATAPTDDLMSIVTGAMA